MKSKKQNNSIEVFFALIKAGLFGRTESADGDADGMSFAITSELGVHRYDVIVNSCKEGTMCGASLTLSIPY